MTTECTLPVLPVAGCLAPSASPTSSPSPSPAPTATPAPAPAAAQPPPVVSESPATTALAAVVGGIGWYRISGEPLLNRQIPFLASAGIAVVVLAVLGAALIVAEQLRTDQNRIGELEQAMRSLTDALAPIVENPARRGDA